MDYSASLPWQTPNYNTPGAYSGNAGYGGGMSGGYGSGSSNGLDLLSALYGKQPSAGQSIASSLPFLNLPQQESKFYQPVQQYSAAAANPTNPLYQQLYGQQKQQGQQNLAYQIQQMGNANRKLSQMGRVPLFDPERGGEQLFRGLTQGYQDVQNNAANTTRGVLNSAAQNASQIAQQQSQIAQNKAGVSGNLLGSLAKLFGL